MLGALLAEAREAGVREPAEEVVLPAAGDPQVGPGVRFACATGFTEYQRMRCSVLDLPLDEDFLAAAWKVAAHPLAVYRIETEPAEAPAEVPAAEAAPEPAVEVTED